MLKWKNGNSKTRTSRYASDLDWFGESDPLNTDRKVFYRVANSWLDHNATKTYHLIIYPKGWYGERETIEVPSPKAGVRLANMHYATGAWQ